MTDLMEKLTDEWATQDTSSDLYRNDGLISLCIGAGAAAFDTISRLYQPVRKHNKDQLSARDLIGITCFYGMGLLGTGVNLLTTAHDYLFPPNNHNEPAQD